MSIINCLLNISFLKCSLSASCIFSSILVYLLHLTIGLACDSKVILLSVRISVLNCTVSICGLPRWHSGKESTC